MGGIGYEPSPFLSFSSSHSSDSGKKQKVDDRRATGDGDRTAGGISVLLVGVKFRIFQLYPKEALTNEPVSGGINKRMLSFLLRSRRVHLDSEVSVLLLIIKLIISSQRSDQ